MKTALLVVLMCCVPVGAYPVEQYSRDGQYFRLYNPDPRGWYCQVRGPRGWAVEWILRAGNGSKWYPNGESLSWQCWEAQG